jgi:hypothetical protein
MITNLNKTKSDSMKSGETNIIGTESKNPRSKNEIKGQLYTRRELERKGKSRILPGF